RSRGLFVPGGQARAMQLYPSTPNRAALAAGAAWGSPDGTDLHLVDLKRPKLLGSATSFPDHAAIISSVAVMADERFALVADNGLYAGNRLAAIHLRSGRREAILPTPNPVAVVASPFGDAALVLNSDGRDALRVFAYKADAPTPFVET